MDYGSENSLSGERSHGIEQCVCPTGYSGLSCEECAFGYVRRHQSAAELRGRGVASLECVACECNGHAATCDPGARTCSPCLHNTAGDRCQLCAPGYYGDATSGRPDACQRCRCPLEVTSNHFSPTCVSTGVDSYVCDQCPTGYEGNHCQRSYTVYTVDYSYL